jgi:hypothetical protein
MRKYIQTKEALPSHRHEASDASARGITLNGVALALILVAIFFALGGLFRRFAADYPTAEKSFTGNHAPAPHLQVNEAQELAQTRAREDIQLNQYAWSNEQSNVVRIPIVRAMELLVQHGATTNGIETGKTRLDMRREKALSGRGRP